MIRGSHNPRACTQPACRSSRRIVSGVRLALSVKRRLARHSGTPNRPSSRCSVPTRASGSSPALRSASASASLRRTVRGRALELRVPGLGGSSPRVRFERGQGPGRDAAGLCRQHPLFRGADPAASALFRCTHGCRDEPPARRRAGRQRHRARIARIPATGNRGAMRRRRREGWPGGSGGPTAAKRSGAAVGDWL